MISQYSVATSVVLAANGSSGDTYTFSVPNSSTDSIVSAWAVRASNTGSQGVQPSGLGPTYAPTSVTTGSNGEITSISFQNQANVSTTWDRIVVIYMTP